MLAQGAVHGAGTLADVVTGTAPGAGSHAERWASAIPVDPTVGGTISGEPEISPEQISRTYDRAFGTGPAAQTFKERIPQAAEAIGMVAPVIRTGGGAIASSAAARAAAPATAAEALEQAARNSPQSMGAASAAPRMTEVSPELQKAVLDAARKNGGAVHPEALSRHVEADTLPVRIQLTPGQALQDPTLISHELNNRARTPGLPQLLDEQNKGLKQNIQTIRDQVGPDVFTTNPVEHGDALMAAYKAKDEPIRQQVSDNYKAFFDAAEKSNATVDGPGFVQSAEAGLKKKMKGAFLPPGIQSILTEFRSGDTPMTFENFENARSILAAEARKAERAGDGNAAAAIGIVRDKLEDLPMTGGNKDLKALADKARSSAKARFDALDADPAYKAAVNDSVAPDQFVHKFVTGPSATRDNVARMSAFLGDDEVAKQTMAVAALDHLRKSAGVDPMGNGTFLQSGYNKARTALDPKLKYLVSPNTADQLEQLGNVARYTQFQPKGSYVNNSNTLVGALGEHAASIGEASVNAKTFGVGGSLIRKAVEGRSAKKLARQTMSPYGGLDQLGEPPQ